MSIRKKDQKKNLQEKLKIIPESRGPNIDIGLRNEELKMNSFDHDTSDVFLFVVQAVIKM